MTPSSLYVFAKIVLKPEFFADGRRAILDILDQTRSEPGCRQFELHQDQPNHSLFLYEEWETEKALEEHYQQPYTQAVFENYSLWLSRPIEVHKMSKL